MVDTTIAVVVAILAAGAGAAAGFVLRGMRASQRMKQAEEKAALIIEKAYSQQKDLILQAKDEQVRLAARGRRRSPRQAPGASATSSAALLQRDEQLDQRADMLEERDRKLHRPRARARPGARRARPRAPGADRRPRAVSQMSQDGQAACCSSRSASEAEHDAVRLARASSARPAKRPTRRRATSS